MNILQINASARRSGSNSTRIADAIVARLRAAKPEAALARGGRYPTPPNSTTVTNLGALK
jgi:FMN-dependent NADH-azoreductase